MTATPRSRDVWSSLRKFHRPLERGPRAKRPCRSWSVHCTYGVSPCVPCSIAPPLDGSPYLASENYRLKGECRTDCLPSSDLFVLFHVTYSYSRRQTKTGRSFSRCLFDERAGCGEADRSTSYARLDAGMPPHSLLPPLDRKHGDAAWPPESGLQHPRAICPCASERLTGAQNTLDAMPCSCFPRFNRRGRLPVRWQLKRSGS